MKIKLLYISYLSLLIIAFIAVSEFILKRKYLKEIIVKHNSNYPNYDIDVWNRLFLDKKNKSYKYEIAPNINEHIISGDYDFRVTTDEFGFRRNPNEVVGGYPIIVLGDSVAWGAGVEDSDTISVKLSNKTGLNTINLGVPARGVYLSLEFIKEKYKNTWNSEYLIYVYCLNDLEESHYIRYFEVSIGAQAFYRRLSELDFNNLSEGTLYLLDVVMSSRLYIDFLDTYKVNDDDIKKWNKHHLKKLKEWSDSNKLKLLVAIPPNRDQLLG